MKIIPKIAVCLVIAIIVNWLSTILQSDYPAKFLEDKVVELLITLMAINTATSGIIVSKLEQVSESYKVNLSGTIKEVKTSVVMQIWLIGIAVLSLILFNSRVIQEHFPTVYKNFFDTVLLTIFISALDILRDTGLAIFVINKALNEARKKP